LGLVTVEDLKLALKLVAAVLLLGGQSGDARRLYMLSGAAAVGFVWQVVANRKARHAQVERDALHRLRAANLHQAPAAADGDADVELPPLVPRGFLEGGIGPGGGYALDLAYLWLSLFCSLYPEWQPLPTLDPLEVDRRRRLDERRAERRLERQAADRTAATPAAPADGNPDPAAANSDDDYDDDYDYDNEDLEDEELGDGAGYGREERVYDDARRPAAAAAAGRPHAD
jgi:hypothetical protein